MESISIYNVWGERYRDKDFEAYYVDLFLK